MTESIPELGIPGIQDAVLIGSGGFARVYRAYQPGLGRHVAVKVISTLHEDATARRFMREARAIGTLSDEPGILTVHEVGTTTAGYPYLVMQLCEAGSLEDRLSQTGPLPQADTIDLTASIADAVAAAHAQGIIHRDLKPANILIGPKGQPLVADFGVAALRNVTGGVTDAMAFSAGFAAPEVFDNDGLFEAADVYALGATAYVLATGHRPYLDEQPDMSPARFIAKVSTEEFTDPRELGVSDALANVIERAMSRDPNARPSMTELATQLRQIRPGSEVTSDRAATSPAIDPAPPRSAESSSRPGGGRTTVIASVLVGLIAVGLMAFGATRLVGGSEPRVLEVAVIDNPHMDNVVALTPELFTAETGIDVNYTTIEFGSLEQLVSADPGTFDVVMIDEDSAPRFAAMGLLKDLGPLAATNEAYNVDDIIPTVRQGLSVDGSLYALPVYAESSLLMYRTDVLASAGLTMPDQPTWQQVADIARAIHSDDMAGICLRGQPGWSDLGASFTSVLNTFGGTWWAANDDGSVGPSQVDQPAFADALNFYVDLLRDAGPANAAEASFRDCFDQYWDGEVAMWFDSTVAPVLIEDEGSPVRGRNGYALSPTQVTDSSGWFWSWALAIPTTAVDSAAAWEFVSWATSEGYLSSAAEQLDGGWAAVPPGTRRSLYANPDYLAVSEPHAARTLQALLTIAIDNPGTTPRPGVGGVQSVGVAGFQPTATQCTELFSAAIARSTTVDEAISTCHDIASTWVE